MMGCLSFANSKFKVCFYMYLWHKFFMSVYLDNNATTPLKESVKKAIMDGLDAYGNPSSAHQHGQKARMMLDEARRQVAQMFGVRAEQVVFTGSGSEANNLALRGYFAKNPHKTLVISAVEHSCVHQTALALHEDFGVDVHILPVDKNGIVDLADLELTLQKKDVGLVSVMHANNETGVIQPIENIASCLQGKNIVFHVDAVQTAGKIPTTLSGIGADIATLSFHKIGGPKGVGAVILSPEVELSAHVTGGSQERNRRAGTENMLGIIGAGLCAAENASSIDAMQHKIAPLRNLMEAELKKLSNELVIIGEDAARVPNTSSIVLPGVEGETAVMMLDIAGYAVSTGSACSSGRVEPSRIILAMGYGTEEALRVIRVSLGWKTTKEDVLGFVAAIKKIIT